MQSDVKFKNAINYKEAVKIDSYAYIIKFDFK